jgi:hypothetical protein
MQAIIPNAPVHKSNCQSAGVHCLLSTGLPLVLPSTLRLAVLCMRSACAHENIFALIAALSCTRSRTAFDQKGCTRRLSVLISKTSAVNKRASIENFGYRATFIDQVLLHKKFGVSKSYVILNHTKFE